MYRREDNRATRKETIVEYERVLGIYAHPDDADVGAGATLARLVREGADVALLLVTAGDAGGFTAEGQERMAERRRAEQTAAAAHLGISDVSFLSGVADGHVREATGLVREIVAAIRRHAPDLILTTSPEYNFASTAANHPDHRAVGHAVVEAAYPAAGNPFDYRDLLAQGLEPHDPSEVWFQGHREINHVSPVTQGDLDRKIAAVRSHVSQFPDLDRMERLLREAAVRDAAGAPEGAEFAECFFRWQVR